MHRDEILISANGILVRKGKAEEWSDFSIDSRTIKERDFFIPIIGENHDGHRFIESAVANGSTGFIIQKDRLGIIDLDHPLYQEITIIMVQNVLEALQHLAKDHLLRQKVKCVGVTGSVGKTTTKDFIASVLSEQEKVLKTKGNFNNEIGLPLTLLDLEESHSFAVLEMGMSSFGEIEKLTEIAPPDLAVITNIGTSHIEFLGSKENIRRAKMEIASKMGRGNYLLLNGDDPLLWAIKDWETDYQKIYYGLGTHNDFYPESFHTNEDQTTELVIDIDGRKSRFFVPAPGEHQVLNALAAIWIGKYYGMTSEKIRQGLSKTVLTGMRFEKHEAEGVVMINDAYNASPESMIASIKIMENMINGRKFLVLGDILELGAHKDEEHRRVGYYIGERDFDGLITFGDASEEIGKGALERGLQENRWRHFSNRDKTAEYLIKSLKKGDQVLFKASRGLMLEKIIDQVIQGRKL